MELLLLTRGIVALLALGFLYNLWIARQKNNKKASKSTRPPEPPGAWPLIGHLHMLGGLDPLMRTLSAMADQCGPVFILRIGVHRTLVISDLNVIKECFTTNDKILATRPSSTAGKLLGFDYASFGFSPYGPYWREMRKIATLELFSNRRLESLKHIRQAQIDACIKELYGLWAQNKQDPVKVEMKQWFTDLTFNMVVMMVAGKQYQGPAGVIDHDEARRFQKAMHELIYLSGVFVASDAFPFLKWIDVNGSMRAMKQTAKEVNLILSSWLEEHRRRRLSVTGDGEKDFIDVLMSILEDGGRIDDYDHDTIIKATSQVLVMAGSDSTASTLTWALSLLLNNRPALNKAQDELDTQVGKDRNVDESDIKNLVYLQAIIHETLRLYPPAPLLVPHEAMEDCQVGGFDISAGTQVMVNIWKVQRDPHLWVDPSEFRPERFLTAHVDVDGKAQHFEYIPFGAGRRSCPGYSMAFQIMHLTLARLVHGFELEAHPNGPVDMTEGLGLTLPRATPLHVLFTPRLPSKLYETLV
ncbi:cytochrome P450 82C4-like protein [Cinnamomum micranthum f. kanehirae]|uniref:Cytochrome P450 82C4-like protein n=1 Tax=Cinnamomum micranthum f. kanehirae TaxID=337451 RepID=A0A3S3LZC2_9MAGN|nr:cytochrome P450 82C4-like protein [Cinnamomum micranthum f. kanehirae]